MTLLALIRHGATAWNGEGRIQGRSDIALSPAGVAELRGLRPPEVMAGATWLSSPMRRARQTADILAGGCQVEERLIETHWGAWEGLPTTVTNAHAARIAARGIAALDLKAPGGESPRDVQARLKPLFRDLGAAGGHYVGVTHKGIVRAALSLAIGWDMEAKAPVKLSWRAAHLFDIAPDGRLSLRAANVMLEARR